MLRVFIDSKKPIAFAFNLRFYRATLFRKGLISCLPNRTAQALPKLFVRLRVARWNVNIRNVVIKRKPANGSSPGEEPKISPGGAGGYSYTLPIRVCAQRGRDFEAPDLERGIHFRGVF